MMTMGTEKKSLIFSLVISIPLKIFRKIKSAARPHLLAWKVKLNWYFRRPGQPHTLPARLIVSVTSYPERFPTLPLTLKCLLSQSVTPDRVILWIAHEDKHALTSEILDLKNHGLEINFCDDLKSYKKIIPTLKLEPNAFIVTSDDDTYYPSTWLKEFVSGFVPHTKEVLCQRAHRILLDETGIPRPYLEWNLEINDSEPSPLNLPTGNGGIMYPPGIFHEDVLKSDTFNDLCPRADDIWLYWMVRLEGGLYRKVGPERRFWTWSGTQSSALWLKNLADEGGNNVRIQAMVERYGFPQ